MVARVDIAVMLHHSRVTAVLRKSAQSRLHSDIIGKRCIENLHEHLSDIFANPQIEDLAQKIAPLLR